MSSPVLLPRPPLACAENQSLLFKLGGFVVFLCFCHGSQASTGVSLLPSNLGVPETE